MTVTGRLIPVDKVVGLVLGDLWPESFSSSFHRPLMQHRQQGQQACLVLQNVTVLISFFFTEGNKKILIHKEKSRFPFSATAHRDFEIFKKAVLDFCGVQSLAGAKVIFNDVLVSSTLTLPVNIFTWKKKKLCSPGAGKFSFPWANIVSSSSK